MGLAALSLLASWAAPTSTAAAARAATTVGLLAPMEIHVARQLRRELGASGFRVVKLDPAVDHDPPWVVTMDPGGTRVLLLVGADDGGERQTHASFAVDVEDEVSIRRAALALVERLRRGDRAGAGVGGGPARPATPTTARPTVVPTPPPPAAALAPAAGPAREPVNPARPSSPPPTSSLTAPIRPPASAPALRARSWALGVATSLDLASGEGRPLGHVQIVGESPLTARLLGQVRVLWPLLGRTTRLDERSVRAWTTGASVGVRLPLRPAEARLRPYLAAATGMRLVLADTDWFDNRHGEVGLTPALTGALCGGLAVRVVPLVHAALEVGGEWSRTLPGSTPRAHERGLAEAPAARVALGISFLY